MKALQDLVGGDRQLLNRIENLDLFRQPQVIEQFPVSTQVDARLEATQVDRHPIAFLVIQRSEHPFSGGHCFNDRINKIYRILGTICQSG